MAKLYGPAMSFSASGQLAKSLVFANWKGVSYGRRYTIPRNANTVSQQATRNLFKWLHDQYKFMPSEVTAV